MEKHPLTLAVAALAATTMVSCIEPPPAPPPRFRPNPPFAPDPVSPEGAGNYTPSPDNPNPYPDRPAPPPPTATGGYPTAQRTDKPNEVISPYEPYNVIDVSEVKPGQLARDPSNQKIFRVP